MAPVRDELSATSNNYNFAGPKGAILIKNILCRSEVHHCHFVK